MITEREKKRMANVALSLAEHLLETGKMRSEAKAGGSKRRVEVRFARNDRSFPEKPDFVYAGNPPSVNAHFQSRLLGSVAVLSIYLMRTRRLGEEEAMASLLSIGVYNREEARMFVQRMRNLTDEIGDVFAVIVRLFELGLDALEGK